MGGVWRYKWEACAIQMGGVLFPQAPGHGPEVLAVLIREVAVVEVPGILLIFFRNQKSRNHQNRRVSNATLALAALALSSKIGTFSRWGHRRKINPKSLGPAF